ncbi:hypothetical protein GPECTOR_1g436 [Gonium pectorale]|uniref:Uncharacterized protein n=1 Tax=Gonium pectorale TaxID=33097 RepID=A0A150H2S9_GONPE|nr:hypothetical protein GPECTOR_1g436 [Gonium pectorale]|eukprot:KXZ56487.1 hypothetical protein GPECTOR_1g436 [Gonium pectorale]
MKGLIAGWPLDVGGVLLVAGFSEAPAGGTVLDLSAYDSGPAFRLLPGTCGASLEFRSLTLLMPPLPPEAIAAAPNSVLAHLIVARGGGTEAAGEERGDGDGGGGVSEVSVLLSNVTLLVAGETELYSFMSRLCEPTSWRHRDAAQLRVLGGVVMYGNDTMQLAPPAPPAVLLRTNVTSRSASAAPWACSATAVSGAVELRATAAELLAVTSGTVLLSLTGNIDFGGTLSAFAVDYNAVLELSDLLLLGLPYARNVSDARDLMAVWLHPVRFL